MKIKFKIIIANNNNLKVDTSNFEQLLVKKNVIDNNIVCYKYEVDNENLFNCENEFKSFDNIKEDLKNGDSFICVKKIKDNDFYKFLFFTLDKECETILDLNTGDFQDLDETSYNKLKNVSLICMQESYVIFADIKNKISIKFINNFFRQIFNNNRICLVDIAKRECIEKIKQYGTKKIELNYFVNKEKFNEFYNKKSKALNIFLSFLNGKYDEKNDNELNTLCKVVLYEVKNKNNNALLEDDTLDKIAECAYQDDEENEYCITLRNGGGIIKSSQLYYNITTKLNNKEFNSKIGEAFEKSIEYFKRNIEEIKNVTNY